MQVGAATPIRVRPAGDPVCVRLRRYDGSRAARRGPLRKKGFEIGSRQRLGDQITLNAVGAERVQQLALRLGFDAFGHTRMPKLCANVMIVFAMA